MTDCLSNFGSFRPEITRLFFRNLLSRSLTKQNLRVHLVSGVVEASGACCAEAEGLRGEDEAKSFQHIFLSGLYIPRKLEIGKFQFA